MPDDHSDLKKEIKRLHGETLALQWLLVSFMYGLKQSGTIPADIIAQSFDTAANITEDIAIKYGKAASAEHTVGAVRIIEQLRKQVFPDS